MGLALPPDRPRRNWWPRRRRWSPARNGSGSPSSATSTLRPPSRRVTFPAWDPSSSRSSRTHPSRHRGKQRDTLLCVLKVIVKACRETFNINAKIVCCGWIIIGFLSRLFLEKTGKADGVVQPQVLVVTHM